MKLSFIIGVMVFQSFSVDSTLVAHWSFEQMNGDLVTLDTSIYKHDLVAVSDRSNFKLFFGPYGRYCSLQDSGTELVVTDSRRSFNSSSFSVMFFVRLSASSENQTLFQSSAIEDGRTSGYQIQIVPTRKVRVCFGDTMSGWHIVESSRMIDTGAFTHIAVTFDGAKVAFYFGGILDQQVGYDSGFSNGYGLSVVGRSMINGNSSDLFKSDFDEVKIYNCAVSVETIRTASFINVDNDGDGFTPEQGDLCDNDASVYPGAYELCDGVDNNCDGVVDDGCGPPSFVTQPRSQKIFLGHRVIFTSAALGKPLPIYQWNKNGVAIPGANNGKLTIESVSIADAGNYSVTISNNYGNSESDNALLTVIEDIPEVMAVAAGKNSSFMLMTDSSLWAGGENYYGLLGDGTQGNRISPVQIMTGVKNMASGFQHSFFIKSDGTLWACGNNYYGQLGDGSTINRSTPVLVMTDVRSVAIGTNHSLILKMDGTLSVSGCNVDGQLGDGTTVSRRNPVQIMTDVQSIAAGSNYSIVLKSDGTVWAFGRNNCGQLGIGSTTNSKIPVFVASGVQSIAAAGGSHNLFIKNDGTLWGWGGNNYGQLGDGTTTNRTTPVQIMSDVVKVSVGNVHSLILKSDSTLWSCGYNNSSQLGNGTRTSSPLPIQIMTGVKSIAAGYYHNLIQKYDTTVWAFGDNIYGELCDGSTTTRSLPVKIMP